MRSLGSSAMIAEPDAIEAAVRFASDRGDVNPTRVAVECRLGEVEGRPVWMVDVRETPAAGDDAWMEIDWKAVSYFVDVRTPCVVGFATERSRTLFGSDWPKTA